MESGQKMRGADAVIKVLAAHGATTVFGYPGGAIMPIYDALYGSPVTHLLSRHEQGAAFAAVGYARASGKTGVCFATSGPGATNLITSLADALLDSVPLVAITGQVSTAVIGTDAFQEIDVLGMSLSCTKHSFMVTDINELIPTLYKAFEIAASGRPGPVLVDIPKDIQIAELEYKTPILSFTEEPAAELSAIDAAKALIQQAKKPILYVGGGVGMAGAVDHLRQFINETGMPSVATLKGLGSIEHGCKGYLGMLGMHGGKAANLAVQACDLLIVVGARFDDRVTGRLATFAQDAKVLHLDIDIAEINKLRQADVSISADLRQVLPALSMPLSLAPWQQEIEDLYQQHQWDYQHPGELIYAPAMLRRLANKLPEDSVVSCDVGQHQMWVAQHMWFRRPEDHLSSAGLGTMGFGLPAAIGAQVARPNATVVTVSGDGSFMMNVQELTTIKRRKLPVKILLIDNQKLGMVKQWQQLFFEQRYSETDLSDNPDFVLMASAFDIPGRTIHHADQVEAALDEMLNTPGPFMLHVAIDDAFNVWPLVPPGACNSDMMDQMEKQT
ncbi:MULTISPECIES: acetolactate synthase 2 catalytic subunit [unclassified Shewanella]|uniref:acetolactate synthase 2 catalytic subunit n=1 Tax=unclassified Shewanella TaxID=196818 RepID=UPI000C81F81B|nr:MULTISPECIES: acetolactate synthase 2 catalytic subunit [unclassified Shewanella]MDO6640148.1 acetolactate synthase 2 catalytic subunit [Shewanella sp. 5_MG-2023]MDO6680361.1 acetolactate synthase 2 catalytic subunit [Shewanella sp. 4_MG-2023]MDO6776955.1 acetolactate synthase 2 catalytic subunit [Shewanella sp. 3_MG-2023]PMG50856.1 acetolactate synthase 2 catalytic subunit [Shewanella sp. 10N.286.52.B9]PMI01833.1 acetolactate synthase 2 catalytic subunit [Shewanella sp. 10N.286.48.A6]